MAATKAGGERSALCPQWSFAILGRAMAEPSEDEREPSVAEDGLAAAMQRVQSGDRESFNRVVAVCERDLRLWIARRAPLSVDCDEVAQRVFIEAFRCRQRYQPSASVRGWLVGIARNCLRQELRRQARSRVAGLDEQRTIQVPLADDDDAWEEGSAALRHCLATLNESHRRAIRWRHAEGLSLAAVAQRLQRSTTATATLLNKLRSRLRDCVERTLRREPRA